MGWTKIAMLMLACSALSACALAQFPAGRVVYCSAEPRVVRSVVVVLGQTTKEQVQRRFGEPFSRQAGPGEGEERWYYDSIRSPFRTYRPADPQRSRSFELLSCSPPEPAGWSESELLEFRFDARGRVSEISIVGTRMPLVDDVEF